jgi:hypothetical protein
MLNDLGLDACVVDVGILGHAKPSMVAVYAPNVPAIGYRRDASMASLPPSCHS